MKSLNQFLDVEGVAYFPLLWPHYPHYIKYDGRDCEGREKVGVREGGGGLWMEVWLCEIHINCPGKFFSLHSAAEHKEEDGKVSALVGWAGFPGRISGCSADG